MKLASIVRLARPLNDFMIGVAVIAGYLTGGGRDPLAAALGFLAGFAISGFSMITNDIFDVEIDMINNRRRPLVTGEVSLGEAKVLAATLLAFGIAVSWITGYATFFVALLFSALAFLYNYRVKRLGLPGNVIVSLSVAIPFLYGGLLAYRYTVLVLIMFAASFLASLSREILKTIADVEGDRRAGVRSLPVLYGARKSAVIASILLLLAIATSYVPVFYGCSIVYLAGISVSSAFFIAVIVGMLKSPISAEKAYSLKKFMLLPMGIGLITFVVEGLT